MEDKLLFSVHNTGVGMFTPKCSVIVRVLQLMRYAEPMRPLRLFVYIRDWASKNSCVRRDNLRFLSGCVPPQKCKKLRSDHVACAMLVWTHLKYLAIKVGKTIYQLKAGLISDYLIQQLSHPSILMDLA